MGGFRKIQVETHEGAAIEAAFQQVSAAAVMLDEADQSQRTSRKSCTIQ